MYIYIFLRCHLQHVLFKVLYLGWNYQGFVCQEDTSDTIEYHLMEALLKCCLIESRQQSNYHRCGRTDKGVSSYGQVILIISPSFSILKHPIQIMNTHG